MTTHALTLDIPVDGVVIAQPKDAFRYGSEAFWLAGFVAEVAAEAQSVLDLGTGSGIIGCLLAARGLSVTGIDIREEWVPCWDITLNKSRFQGQLSLQVADVADGWRGPLVDLVVSNPPFFRGAQGPVSPNQWRAAARTEGTATLSQFIEVGFQALKEQGWMALVLPSVRATEVLQIASRIGVYVNRHVVVGERRVLLALSHRQQVSAVERVDPRGPETQGWYQLATARPSLTTPGKEGE